MLRNNAHRLASLRFRGINSANIARARCCASAVLQHSRSIGSKSLLTPAYREEKTLKPPLTTRSSPFSKKGTCLTRLSSSSTSAPYQVADISPDEYHKLSDRCLDALTDYLEVLTESFDGPGADEYEAEYSSGVLNLRLGPNGTYVINKQPPNKQIWLSSPRSGPKRFDYDKEKDTWFMIKEGDVSTMRELLDSELSSIFDTSVAVNLGER